MASNEDFQDLINRIDAATHTLEVAVGEIGDTEGDIVGYVNEAKGYAQDASNYRDQAAQSVAQAQSKAQEAQGYAQAAQAAKDSLEEAVVLEEAPKDGKQYARKDGGWTEVEATGGGGGEGTVTSVGVSVPSGLNVTNSPITTSGTIVIGLEEGKEIPFSSDVQQGVTAYGWGDHSQAGYAKASSLADVATSGNYDDLNNTPTLGDLASKDKVGVEDINASGSPSTTTFLRGDGTWTEIETGGGGVENPINPKEVKITNDEYDDTSSNVIHYSQGTTSYENFAFEHLYRVHPLSDLYVNVFGRPAYLDDELRSKTITEGIILNLPPFAKFSVDLNNVYDGQTTSKRFLVWLHLGEKNDGVLKAEPARKSASDDGGWDEGVPLRRWWYDTSTSSWVEEEPSGGGGGGEPQVLTIPVPTYSKDEPEYRIWRDSRGERELDVITTNDLLRPINLGGLRAKKVGSTDLKRVTDMIADGEFSAKYVSNLPSGVYFYWKTPTIAGGTDSRDYLLWVERSNSLPGSGTLMAKALKPSQYNNGLWNSGLPLDTWWYAAQLGWTKCVLYDDAY